MKIALIKKYGAAAQSASNTQRLICDQATD